MNWSAAVGGWAEGPLEPWSVVHVRYSTCSSVDHGYDRTINTFKKQEQLFIKFITSSYSS